MANSIGTLLVELGVNIAAFNEGMDKATYKAKQAGKDIGHAFEGLGNSLGGLLSRFGEIGNVVGEALGGAGETVAKLSGSFGSLGGAAGTAAVAVAGIAAVGVAGAAALGAMAISGAELVHELEMVSAKTGIGTDQLLAYKAAGSTVGVSLDAMVMAFRRFDQALLNSGKGSAQAGIILKALGVTAVDNKEALNQVADAFKKMEDGPAKAADAVALFGRTGLNMIPFLNKGREGLAEFNKMVDEYGPKVGKDAKEANEAYLVSQAKLSLAWESMTVAVEKNVLPIITKMITAFADLIKWTGDTAKAFDSWVTKMVNDAAYLSVSLFSDEAADRFAAGISKAEAATKAQADAEKKAADEKERAKVIAGENYAAELKNFLAIKAGGSAAEELRATQEKINVLLEEAKESSGSAQAVNFLKQAEAAQKMIPALERAAKLEKERRDYALHPQETVVGPSRFEEAVKALRDQAEEQDALNKAINEGVGSRSVLTAQSKAALQMDRELEQAIAKEKVAQQEMNRAMMEHGPATQATATATDKYNEALQELQRIQDGRAKFIQDAGAKAAAAEAQRFIDEMKALDADAEAWNQNTNAIGKGIEERIKAAAEAERIKVKSATGSDLLAEAAAAKVSQKMHEDDAASIRKMAEEQYAMNYQIDEQIRKLLAARKVQQDAGQSTLLIDAAIFDEREKQLKQWDDAIRKVGTFRENMRVSLNEIYLEGKNVWAKFGEAFKTAIDSMNTELAKFATTGKANFKQVGEQLYESIVKATLQKAESSILGKFGIGGKPDGSKSNPIWTKNADGGIGGILGGGGDSGGETGGDEGEGTDKISGMMNALKDKMSGIFDSLKGVFSSIAEHIGSIVSGIGHFIGSLFGGGMAEGGNVTPGKAYVVGEKHPEFFIPGKSGAIVPTVNMGGGPRVNNVSVHFHGVQDADSFRKSQAQIAASIHRTASIALNRGV